MALIPPDAALRLRMQTEASLMPVTPLKELPADLPDLRPGQTFTARIQQPLPENSYRALVGGKEITLSLPGSVKTGDTLELVVVERNPRMVLAQLASTVASQGDSEAGDLAKTTQLSPAGQMIGKLLLPAGQQPQPVMLNRGEPLVTITSSLPASSQVAATTPPATPTTPTTPTTTPAATAASATALVASSITTPATLAATLAPRLQQAATQSGLFYESHQALWISGQHSTEALLEEPQARHAPLPNAKLQTAAESGAIQNQNIEPKDRIGVTTSNATEVGATEPEPGSTAKSLLQSIPVELRPLVQQQLDAAATQRLAWQGEVWPGQTMQWQIGREVSDNRPNTSADAVEQWNTSLALTTPRLGRVEATLGIAGNTVRIGLVADSAESLSRLNQHLPALQAALEAAGLKPLGLQARAEND